MVGAADENEAEEDRSFSPPPSSSPPPPPPSPRLQPPASPPPRPGPIPSLHPPASPPPVLAMTDVGENPRRPSNPSASKEEEDDDPRQQGGHAAAWRQAQAGLRLPVSTNITCAGKSAPGLLHTLRPAAETGREGIEEGCGGGGGFGDAEERGRVPRQPYRGGYTEGKTADEFGRPHRSYERCSGTGRGYGMKRDGAGRANWGTATDEGLSQENVEAVSTEEVVSVIEDEKNPEDEPQTKAEKLKEGAGNEEEEKEADDKKEYEKVKEGAENEEEEKEAEDKKEYEKVKEGAENEEEEKEAEDKEPIQIIVTEKLEVGLIGKKVHGTNVCGKMVVQFPPELDRRVQFMVGTMDAIDFKAHPCVDRDLFNLFRALRSETFPEKFELLKWYKNNGQFLLPLVVICKESEDEDTKTFLPKNVTMHFLEVTCIPTGMINFEDVVVHVPAPRVDHLGVPKSTRRHIWKSFGSHLEHQDSVDWLIPHIRAADKKVELIIDMYCYDGWQEPAQFFPIRVEFSHESIAAEVGLVVSIGDGQEVEFVQQSVGRGSYVIHHPQELARRAAEEANALDPWEDWEDAEDEDWEDADDEEMDDFV